MNSEISFYFFLEKFLFFDFVFNIKRDLEGICWNTFTMETCKSVSRKTMFILNSLFPVIK